MDIEVARYQRFTVDGVTQLPQEGGWRGESPGKLPVPARRPVRRWSFGEGIFGEALNLVEERILPWGWT
jgi:hypothetical protein